MDVLKLENLRNDLCEIYQISLKRFNDLLQHDHDVILPPLATSKIFQISRLWYEATLPDFAFEAAFSGIDVGSPMSEWKDLESAIDKGVQDAEQNEADKVECLKQLVKCISEPLHSCYSKNPFHTKLIFAYLIFRFVPYCVYLKEPDLFQDSEDWCLESIRESVIPLLK